MKAHHVAATLLVLAVAGTLQGAMIIDDLIEGPGLGWVDGADGWEWTCDTASWCATGYKEGTTAAYIQGGAITLSRAVLPGGYTLEQGTYIIQFGVADPSRTWSEPIELGVNFAGLTVADATSVTFAQPAPTQWSLYTIQWDVAAGNPNLGTPLGVTIDGGANDEAVIDGVGNLSENGTGFLVDFTPLRLCDANGDGVVDAADYLILKQNMGQATSAGAAEGDFDASGTVDAVDLRILAAEIAGPVQAIPEPATLGLLAMGALALIRRRRR